MRRFHRWFGVGSAAIVLLTVVTGLLWAYGPWIFWEPGYREKKHPVATVPFENIQVSPPEAIRAAQAQLGAEAVVSAVTLRSEVGHALYEITATAGGQDRAALVDAITGTPLSPLTPELATKIARQYVAGQPAVQSVTLLDQFKHRSGKVHDSVYQVNFDTENKAEIFVAANSGQLIEDQDSTRRIHFWVMRLHMLNFFGFKKTLTIIPGTAILLLIGSGLWLSRKRKARRLKDGSVARETVELY